MHCSRDELLDHGWKPFVDRDDGLVVARMLANASTATPSIYDLRARTRSNERLYLSVRTVAVYGASEVRTAGSVELLAWESPRSYVFLDYTSTRPGR